MVVGWRSSLELACEIIKLVREILYLSGNFINLCLYLSMLYILVSQS